ncbi:MAG: 2-amino-4-hydroxy-6-hydroxymethyldihydropteridine diphosphokinase [Flavobacteriales bacterium]|nr:2-amino-4-hydroxy-6-hydroxymethyldihydropteridine diphosphokinase [Flavobacteriales bacterium]
MLYYLSLGGNVGDTREIFRVAMDEITREIGEIISRSSVIITPPWGFSAENDFMNMALIVKSDITPSEVLGKIWEIERRGGRVRPAGVEGYSSRTLDIDIIFIDDMVIDTPRLKVPHPLAHRRRFVLEPMCEIAPDYIHPVIGKSIKTLMTECDE